MIRYKFHIIFASTLLIVLSVLALFLGSELISPANVLEGLQGKGTYSFIILEIRLPRVFTAILSGAALSVAGLLMQSYFRNVLAGPYILGVSSGGSLGVAILIMSGTFINVDFTQFWNAPVLFSILGSLGALLIVMLLSRKIGNGPMLLIAGMMIGAFSSALVSVMQYFSQSEAIKKFLIWTMGSLTSVDLIELIPFSIIILVFLLFSLVLCNHLNAYLLGETQAASLGISPKFTKWSILTITGVLAGMVTAYCGPIAFIGLSAPHVSRLLLKSQNHHVLLPFSAVLGAIMLVSCDLIAQLPGYDVQLPINAVTSLVGAPIVIAIILKNRPVSHV